MESTTKGPLLICLGGNTIRKCSPLAEKDIDILMVDTDSRALKDHLDHSLLVGYDIVNGEGTGGNLNLARACYRKDMELIGQNVLGRPLVIIVADCEGSTSVAGAVEINSLLVKVGLPSLSLLLVSDGVRKTSSKTRNMAQILLEGPLRPGINLDISEETIDDEGLLRSLELIYIASSRSAEIQIPGMVWNLLRQKGGPFIIRHRKMERDEPDPDPLTVGDPSVMVINVDKGTTSEEVKDFMKGTFGSAEGINFGILETGEKNSWEMAIITPGGQKDIQGDQPQSNVPMRSHEDIMNMLGSEVFEPRTTF